MITTTLAEALWTHGSLFDSALLGAIAASTLATLGLDASKKSLAVLREHVSTAWHDPASNHDLMRALRLAECDAAIMVCELTLRQDYGIASIRLRSFLDSTRAWNNFTKTIGDREAATLLSLRRALLQHRGMVTDASPEQLDQLVGAALADVRQLARAGLESSPPLEFDTFLSDISATYLEHLNTLLDTSLDPPNALPLTFRSRFLTSWLPLLARAFREHLKGSGAARHSFFIDTLCHIDESLEHNAEALSKRLDNQDSTLGEIMQILVDLRGQLDDSRFKRDSRALDTISTKQDDILDRLGALLVHLSFTQPESPRHSQLLNEGDSPSLFQSADPGSATRLGIIENLLTWIAKQFHKVFILDRSRNHPLFESLRRELEPMIPGVHLDLPSGTLDRIGVRHVILRSHSVIELARTVPPAALEGTGHTIGLSAAQDLFDQVLIESNKVPISPRAFVELWDYWDSSGGWGRLDLVDMEPFPSGSPSTASKAKTWTERIQHWRLRVSNNFLMVEGNLDDTHRLCSFWCGYIMGFLSYSLPELWRMIDDLNDADFNAAAIPTYLEAISVEHIEDKDIAQDVFLVTLRDHKHGPSLRHFSSARRLLRYNKLDSVQPMLSLAIVLFLQECGAELTPKLFDEIGFSQSESAALLALSEGRPATPPSSETLPEVLDVVGRLLKTRR